ncbi:Major facilitator superfamily protein [Rhynchospora pubera]|uniref:Major facilitator superfamily protein n=1 Tax=Rhynchospora pubera TaxID=906938 RepID=A0AAV8HWI5_9POAL|nr:Major facilitator superfamily protein [Rhynchospora pubera]
MEQEGDMKVADVVDCKGWPADKSKTGGWKSASLVLGIEITERLSTIGIGVNLVTYLVGTMHLPSADSANIVTNFLGTSFMLCFLGGLVADTFLGRFATIAIFSVVQALGTGLLSVSTGLPQLRPSPCNSATERCQQASNLQMTVLYLCLYLIALGTGGLKSSVSGFGSDQFDEKDEKERTQMTSFFSRFFFFISTGTFLAVTMLVYIQDEVGRSWAYGMCCIFMVISIAIFLSGTRRYRYKKRAGSPIVHILQVIVASFRKRKLVHDPNVMLLYENGPEATRIPHTEQYSFLDKAAIQVQGDDEQMLDSKQMTNPWNLCSVSRVEEVKMLIRLLPVWATTIMFWTVHAQMLTFSVEQASTMERNVGRFNIPAGSLTAFFVGGTLITLAVYDRVVVPLCRSWKDTQGFTNLQRIGIGLALSVLGMIAAALMENRRLSVARSAGSRTTLPISAFTLIPQFFLVGSGEAFIYTGQLDFFITRSPKSMKTMSTGLFLTTLSLGLFLSSFLVSVVTCITNHNGEKGWLADNINKGRLDYFYALLAVLSTINFIAYLAVTAFVIKPQSPANSGKTSVDNNC